MSNLNTIKRTLCTLGFIILYSQTAGAQSVLNFSRAVLNNSNTGIAITNPTSYYADVILTFYGLDGNPVANGALNPMNYRISPKSQIQVSATDIFSTQSGEGWIQATSSTSGLLGFYFTGDFNTTLDGSEALTPMTSQVLPLIRQDQSSDTTLVIVNPGSTAANVVLSLWDLHGTAIGSVPQTIQPHAVWKYHPASSFPIFGLSGTSARVTSSSPVTATSVVTASDLLFVNGQPVDQAATSRIIPHFLSGSGADSQIVLLNPNSFSVKATVTLLTQSGGSVNPAKAGPSAVTVTIPPNGESSLTASSFFGQPVTPDVNGWVQINSSGAPLDGLVVLDSGVFLGAVPMQTTPFNSLFLSQLTDSPTLYTQLDLVNTATTTAIIDATLFHPDGTVLIEKQIPIAANSKISSLVTDLIPEATGIGDGFMYIRASSGIYGVEMVGGKNLQFISTVDPLGANLDFVPNPAVSLPQIFGVDPGTNVTPGSTIRLTTSATDTSTQVLVANLILSPQFITPSASVFSVELPANLEFGYANLRIRINGLESLPITLHVVPPEDQGLAAVHGSAFYQKIFTTDAGLDLSHPTMAPIRRARVEVVDPATQTLISASETDSRGGFVADVPPRSAVTIRVLSRQRSTDLEVVDFPSTRRPYAASAQFDPRESNSPPKVVDRTRISGAFNILEMIQRSNEMILLANRRVIPPAPTIFWSTRNTYSTIGTTHFTISSNTAYILGDRNVDSDEYDDSVIVHEYGHLIAARFSRDDSPGGPHGIGELQDPRLAWSEGWANFFSSAVRNDPIYRDSKGPNGSSVYRFDVKDSQPPNDQPGYMSEATVHSLLLDLFDNKSDTGKVNVQYSFTEIWNAFSDLANDHYVYLPYFLDHLVARHPADAGVIQAMAMARSIDFEPNARPSVTNSWPRPVTIGDSVTGYVDSLTTQREHLAASGHFFTFTIPADEVVSMRLDVTGVGPGNNPNANDLDLFLEDLNGSVLAYYDSGGNGASKLIARKLAAGTYVLEIRSYYRKANNNTEVFNSGDYRLRVSTQ